MALDVENMSLEELEEHGRAMLEKAREIRKENEARLKAEILELQDRKSALLSELEQIDQRIHDLNSQTGSAQTESVETETTITDAIVDFVREKGVANSKELRGRLEGLGLNTDSLGQLVAYLKRQKRLESAGWGRYRLWSPDSASHLQVSEQD